jgi:hypothetical protein
MKKIFTLLFGLMPLCALADSTEIVGAEMTYTYAGNHQYEVKLNIYTFCNQSTMDSVYIHVASPSSNFKAYNVLADLKDMGELPSDCHTGHHHITTCDDPASTRPGFRKWTATAIFTLYNSLACEYTFSWRSCCRTKLLTNGGANEPFYIDAYMNICGNADNSSQEFINPYQPYLPVGQCAVKEYTSMAQVGSGTYRYELVPPKSSETNTTTFTTPYSYKEPLSHSGGFGHPDIYNPDYGCAGFQLNTVSGELTVRSVNGEEVFPVAVNLARYVDGKLVSRITRDLMYWTQIMPANRPPLVTGIDCKQLDSITIEPNSSACFTICSFDPDMDDTVRLEGIMESIGAHFTVEEGKKWPKAQYCWTPYPSDLRTAPYKLVVTAKDNHECDEMYGIRDNGTSEKIIWIYVRDLHGYYGIEQNYPKYNLALYPQPAQNIVTADIPETFVREATLTDMTGRNISPSYTLAGGKLHVDISGLPAGTYVIRVYTDKNVYSGKLVITK